MIASAIISGLGTAASGLMSYFNNKKSQEQADAEYARQQAYNEARAAENPLARSENQAIMNEYDRKAKQQVETARNKNVITGGTQEMDLATQQAVANGRASLMSGISAQASTNADKYKDRAEAARQAKYADDQARSAARNETFAALAANAANAMSGLYAEGSQGVDKAAIEGQEAIEAANAVAAAPRQIAKAEGPSVASIAAGAGDKLRTTMAASARPVAHLPESKPSVAGLTTTSAPSANMAPTASEQARASKLATGSSMPTQGEKAAVDYIINKQTDPDYFLKRQQRALDEELYRDWRRNL